MNTDVLARRALPAARAPFRDADHAVPERAQTVVLAPPTGRQSATRPIVLRSILLGGCALAAVLAWAAVPSAPSMADPGLATLLRGMAAVKTLLALLGTGLVHWRFALPVSARAALAYIACSMLLTVACVFLWQLAFIAFAAVLFHLAGIGALVLAWREGRSGPRFAWDAPRSAIGDGGRSVRQ